MKSWALKERRLVRKDDSCPDKGLTLVEPRCHFSAIVGVDVVGRAEERRGRGGSESEGSGRMDVEETESGRRNSWQVHTWAVTICIDATGTTRPWSTKIPDFNLRAEITITGGA